MATDDSQELPAIRQHFSESVEVLAEISELLGGIRESATASETGAKALDKSSEVLAEVARQLSKVASQIGETVKVTELALEASKKFLEETDLTQLSGELAIARELSESQANMIIEKIGNIELIQAQSHSAVVDAIAALGSEFDERSLKSEERAAQAEVELANERERSESQTNMITEKIGQAGLIQSQSHAAVASAIAALRSEFDERALKSEERAARAEGELEMIKKILPARTLKRL